MTNTRGRDSDFDKFFLDFQRLLSRIICIASLFDFFDMRVYTRRKFAVQPHARTTTAFSTTVEYASPSHIHKLLNECLIHSSAAELVRVYRYARVGAIRAVCVGTANFETSTLPQNLFVNICVCRRVIKTSGVNWDDF